MDGCPWCRYRGSGDWTCAADDPWYPGHNPAVAEEDR